MSASQSHRIRTARRGPATLTIYLHGNQPALSINKSCGLLREREREKKNIQKKKNPSRWLACVWFKELAPHQQPKLNGVKTLIILPQLSSYLMLTDLNLLSNLRHRFLGTQAIKAMIRWLGATYRFSPGFQCPLNYFLQSFAMIPHWFLDAACLCTSRAKYSRKYKLLEWCFGYRIF